ncbi:HicA protein [Alcanivorax sp. MD8A]|uniref:type II toxin-antitoxin system HicA family toxin n=1 Tax=Alcanivorax sp. MD8A TaxID=1177157 RepID=UPI000C9C8891|nr:type II toxin-antitoxin system HicA family toxin [Alcanivorax sp. MD8A]PNE02834.1 HicA protein [Alcanivorax sp. MD8A]
MSKPEKLIAKLRNLNGSFTWQELEKLLHRLGYEKQEGRGSRVKFSNGNPADMINLHKPHPGNDLKKYARRQIIEKLENGGLI